MEHYLAIRKNEILLLIATTWMNQEGVMPSEISQAEKDRYHKVSFTCRIFYRINNKQTEANSDTRNN